MLRRFLLWTVCTNSSRVFSVLGMNRWWQHLYFWFNLFPNSFDLFSPEFRSLSVARQQPAIINAVVGVGIYREVVPHIKTKWSCRMWMKRSKNSPVEMVWCGSMNGFPGFTPTHAELCCSQDASYEWNNRAYGKLNNSLSWCFRQGETTSHRL